jgi:hypothetical protein
MSPSERTFLFPNPHCLSYKLIVRLSTLTCLTIGDKCFRPRLMIIVGHGAPQKLRSSDASTFSVPRSESSLRLHTQFLDEFDDSVKCLA